jgi:hypothetical protein
MLLRRSRINCWLLCLLALSAAVPSAARAQSNKSQNTASTEENETLKALLSEVRQLRMVIERMTLNGYRAQIVVQRLGMQQGRVDRLARELEGVRNEISDLTSNLPVMEVAVEEMKTKHKAGTVGETEVKRAMAQVEQQMQHLQQLRVREGHLVAQLETERGVLDDLANRLDALERELKLSPADKEAQPGKRRNE